MEFFRLATTMKLVEAQLLVAIRSGAPARIHAGLFKQSAILLDRLERYEPESQAELRDAVGFFVRRASSRQRTGDGQHELEIAVALTNRYRDADLPEAPRDAAPDFQPVKPVASAPDPADLAALIDASPDHLALVDDRLRILAVSGSCAAAHRTTRVGMMGAHASELSGQRHFQAHCRHRLEACLRGEMQDYAYTRDNPIQGARRVQCRMTPVADRRGSVYCALVQLTDAGHAPQDAAEPQCLSLD